MSDDGESLPAGHRIEQYVIERVLGVGGFGITYLAADTRLGMQVAIKEFLPTEVAIRDRGSVSVRARTGRYEEFTFGLRRFLDEARALARFNHPNIVRVLNFLEAHNTAYLVMDFVEGRSLADYLKSHKEPLTPAQLIGIAEPILRGLSVVHAGGFLHRDIKPGNIYLRREGEPLLIDFGAARQALGEHSRSVTGIVSAGYAPPEQYSTDAKKQGPWTDLYGLGATLYRCISGEDPVDSLARREAQAEGEPDPLRPAVEVGRGRYTVELLALVDRLLALSPKQRPGSAEEALAALSAVNAPVTPTSGHAAATPPASTGKTPTRGVVETLDNGAGQKGRKTRLWNVPILGWMLLTGFMIVQLVLWLQRADTTTSSAQNAVQVPALAAEVLSPSTPIPNQTSTQSVPFPSSNPSPPPAGTAAPLVAPPTPVPSYHLWVETNPADARVVLPGIAPRYSPGMSLPPGVYKVRVQSAGYETLDQEVDLQSADSRVSVTLQRDTLIDQPEIVVIPAGSFMMGSPSTEPGRSVDEGPQHTVNIDSFGMATTEVTFAQYDVFATVTGITKPDDEGWGRGDRPVINVSWEDATAYAAWLSEQTGKKYRLPTEAEWEYAARAGAATAYYWGDNVGDYNANCNGCGSRWDSKQTAPVRSFPPNGFRLYEMHGNVWEWTEDCYNSSYAGAPEDGGAWSTGDCERRVYRGGGWYSYAAWVRSASRSWNSPAYRGFLLGFRVAQSLERSQNQNSTSQNERHAAAASFGLEMINIPAGAFDMGSNEGVPEERPVHAVTVKAFRLAATEVTVAQFARFVDATGYRTDAERNAGEGAGCFSYKGGTDFGWQSGSFWRSMGFSQGADHPVVCVSWNDAKAFAQWMVKETGERYRLPTEAEWEYAARAGARTKYSFGDEELLICEFGNVADALEKRRFQGLAIGPDTAKCEDGWVFTAPVRSFRENLFGLYDMHGNVSEWVEDCVQDYSDTPDDGSAWKSCDQGVHVLRGGSWFHGPARTRSADRSWSRASYSLDSYGFRLAQDAE